MSSDSVDSAIRDVAPTLLEPFPDQLRQLTSQIYRSSKQKISLKQNEEIARLHLSAIIAVQKLQSQLNITDPSIRNLPVPQKMGKNLLFLFQTHLDSNTPVSTPKAKRIRESATPTPSQSPSPTKKQRVGRPTGSKTKSPFLRKLEAITSASVSPTKNDQSTSTSPLKNQLSLESIANNPQDQSPSKSNISPLKNLQLLTSREIVTLCNKYQLEKPIADDIIATFLKFSTSISNEWILIVGLILNCYFVVNHKALSEQLGNRSAAIKIMHQLQSGGLKLIEIQSSVEVVEILIRYSKWFKQLKFKYDYPLDDATNFDESGAMISEAYQYTSKSNLQKYEEWVYEIEQQIQENSNSK